MWQILLQYSPISGWHILSTKGQFFMHKYWRELGSPSSGMTCNFLQLCMHCLSKEVSCWSPLLSKALSCWNPRISREVIWTGSSPSSGKDSSTCSFKLDLVIIKLLRPGSLCKFHLTRDAMSLGQLRTIRSDKLKGKPPSGKNSILGQLVISKVFKDVRRSHAFSLATILILLIPNNSNGRLSDQGVLLICQQKSFQSLSPNMSYLPYLIKGSQSTKQEK